MSVLAYCLTLAKSLRHLMPQDVFPETKLSISMALQISDCFAVEGSNATMLLCQPLDRNAKAPTGNPIS